jgi:serine/threonine-protein kinase
MVLDFAVESVDSGQSSEPRPAPCPAPGDVIDGAYRVLGEIGRGAMGVVLSALDLRLERKVAIKLIRAELLEPGFCERFKLEARAMARVNHPNVLCIHAFGEHQSVPYFVMELVDGQTLEDWLERSAPDATLDLKLKILDDLCKGVTAIHEAGAVHRDIKPSNVLLDGALRPRVADLGVAAWYMNSSAATNEVVGTPAYMAPEIPFSVGQVGTPSPLVDVYSVACVAYELLTGRLPFDAGCGEFGCMLAHATAEVPAPTSVCPELPHTFDAVLMAGLAKKPEERTPTVEMFRRALAEARAQSLEPVRIVVAEDDDDFRELLELKLGLDFPDADIECFANGHMALEALEHKPASVAIFDLQMPVLDGMALTERVRAHEPCANMPIIVLTASGGPEEWRRLSSLGADRFLVKPVNRDDVVTLIRRSMRERAGGPAPSSRLRL